MRVPTSVKQWAYTLASGCIAGGAGAVVQFFSMAGAKSLGLDVPTLNLKAVGVLFGAGILSHGAAILVRSPLPPVEFETTSVTITQTKTTPSTETTETQNSITTKQ